MRYGSTTEATDWNPERWATKAIKALLFFIPRANKDNEALYPFVRKWLVEVNENGEASREIGLDKNDKTLFTAPNSRNSGYWTDNPKIFTSTDLQPVEKEYFENLWQNTNESA